MSNSKPLIESTVFSHGTMDCRDAHKTQRFLQEFLGVRSVRKSEGTQYIWLGGWWIVACLTVGGKVPPRQGDGYRFGLLVETPEEVDAAHAAAVEQREKWDILDIKPVAETDGGRAFCLRDFNGNWWEIYHRPGHLYDDLFAREAAEA